VYHLSQETSYVDHRKGKPLGLPFMHCAASDEVSYRPGYTPI